MRYLLCCIPTGLLYQLKHVLRQVGQAPDVFIADFHYRTLFQQILLAFRHHLSPALGAGVLERLG